MAEMQSMRLADEAGLAGIVPDAFEKSATDIYMRTGKEPLRNKPHG